MKFNRYTLALLIVGAMVQSNFLAAQEKGNAADAKPTTEKVNSSAPPSGQRLEAPPPRNDVGNFDAVKNQIKATDEEWKVIGPKFARSCRHAALLIPD